MSGLIRYICLLLIFIPRTGFSQSEPDPLETNVGLSFAINHYQIKENILNKIRHTGFFPALGFSYQWSTSLIKQRAELDLIVNMLKSRYESEHSPLTSDISLNYRQVRKLSEFKPAWQLYIGGVAGLYSHISYFENWDDSHIYWLTYYYLGFNELLFYGNPSKSSAYLELAVPLISLVSRPPARFLYKVINDKFSWIVSKIHRDMRLTSIHQHFVINLDFGYIFKHSASFKQKIYWHFSYTNTALPDSKEVAFLINILGTELLF